MNGILSIDRRRRTARALIPLSAVGFSCATAWAGTLQGTATYRERMALPPDAVFEAELQDVSRADAAAQVLGRTRLDPAGQPPFRFEIAYDDAATRKGHRYTVRARVEHQGRLLFTTDRHYPALGGGNAPLELLLVSARGGAKPEAAAGGIGALPASWEGELPGAGNPIAWHVDLLPEGSFQLRTTHIGRPEPNRFDDIGRWTRQGDSGRIVLRGGREAPVYLMPVEGGAALRKLDLAGKPIESAHNDRLARLPEFAPIEPRLELTGMFSYMADAASITLCADGRRLPVAMEGDFKALEAAYREAGLEAGQPLLASVEGLIARRPSMEESQPPRATLVVERFLAVTPRESCGTPLADSPLYGTYWQLVQFQSSDDAIGVIKPDDPTRYTLELAADGRLAMRLDCNRANGRWSAEASSPTGGTLSLGPLAMTRAACPAGSMDSRLAADSARVRSYTLAGDTLNLALMADAGIYTWRRLEKRP